MKIGMAQINTIVGNIPENVKKIEDVIEKFGKDADIIIFPESCIAGSPLYDLNNNVDLIKEQKKAIEHIKSIVSKIKNELVVVVGFVDMQGDEPRKFFESAAVISDDVKVYHKQELENKGIKNEPRYFDSGTENLTFSFGGKYKGGITIGKDLENESIIQKMKAGGVDAVFNLSSNCFEGGDRSQELKRLGETQKKLSTVLVQVNQVGSESGITFEGGSKIISNDGKLLNNAKKFNEVVEVVDTETDKQDYSKDYQEIEHNEDVLQSLKLALKDYLEKRNIEDVVIGVSGGMDSALDLAIVAQVLSPEHIHAIYMPTKFNSDESLKLSQQLANNLGVELKVGPIQDLLVSYEKFAEDYLGKKLGGVSHENVQARIRGNILMNLGNDYGAMVVNNSNKTELELGYGTLYGDLIGGLCLIGDLKKNEVYDLARYINKDKEIIPRGIIDRKASAELSEGQVDPFNYDRDSDPVDELAFGKTIDEVSEKYHLSKEYLESLKKRIDRSRFKSAQIPPVVKVSDHTIRQGTEFPL